MPLLDDLIKNAQANSSAFQKLSTTVAERKLGSASASSPNKAPGVQGAYDFGGSNLPQTAQQKLLSSPIKMQDWSLTDKATSSDVYARIYQISQTDRARADELLSEFRTLQATPSSRWYNPYSQATNNAIAEIAALGADVSGGINEKFFNDYAWLKDHYRYGTGNSPLSPAKKATKEENAAYWYYKLLDAEETTQKAENEWAALQEEVAYWANRKDRNYSFDEVLDKVNWDNYKTLDKLDADRGEGRATMLNRSVGYSRDNLRGVYWAAQNGSTGNMDADSAMSILGRGKGWTQNDTIRNKLNPASADYSPYSVGSTLDDAALYFGVSSFGKDWLEKNRGYLANGDETAQKMYGKVYEAEQNTQKAEAELKELRDSMEDYLSGNKIDAEQVISWLKDDYDAMTTLKRMDESREKGGGNLVATTRAVDYRWEDIEAEVRRRAEEKNKRQNSAMTLKKANERLNGKESILHGAAEQESKDVAIGAANSIIQKDGTPAEKAVFKQAGSFNWTDFVRNMWHSLVGGDADADIVVQTEQQQAADYAADHYFDSRKTIDEYENAQKELDDARKKIDEILGGQKAASDKSGIGQYGKGNIDLYARKPVTNDDGSISTVDSFSVNIDGKEVLLPTIVNGTRVSEEEAIDHYMKTGENLGVFNTPKEADEYAQRLHEQQEALYTQPETSSKLPGPGIVGVSANTGTSDQPMSRPLAPQTETEQRQYRIWASRMGIGTIVNPEIQQETYRQWRDSLAEEAQNLEDSQVEAYVSTLPPEVQEEYYAASKTIQENEAALADLQTDYEQSQRYMEGIANRQDVAAQVAATNGVEPGPDAVQAMNDLYEIGAEYKPTQFSADTVFDAMVREGVSKDEALAYAKQYAEQYEAELARIQGLLDAVPDKAKKGEVYDNVRREQERLERDLQEARDYLLQGEKDFDKTADEAIKKVTDATVNTRSALYAKGYSELDMLIADPSLLSRIAPSEPQYRFERPVGIMTDAERKTYFYIRETQGAEAAQSYYLRLTDDTHGILTTRQGGADAAAWDEYTKEHPIGANFWSIVTSPARITSGIYAGVQLATGQDINPNSQWRAVSNFGNTVKSTSKQGITDYFGENTLGAKIANLGYDVFSSVGESTMNTLTFGALVPSASGLGKIVTDFLGAVPMGLSAAGDAISEAVSKGADPSQALGIGAVTLLAEAGTEAITLGNMRDAFSKGAADSAAGLKAFIVDTIKDMGEEAAGEMINEAVESLADDAIMGELSQRQERIDYYMSADGGAHSQQEAEDLANREIVHNVLYAGLTGALSGAVTTTTSAAAGKVAQRSANARISRNNIAILEEAAAADVASQTGAVAAVLATDETDMASMAAAVTMSEELGNEPTLNAIKHIEAVAARAGMQPERVHGAIKTAALGKGNSYGVLVDIAEHGATREKVNNLVEAAAADIESAEVQESIDQATEDIRVAQNIRDQAANGAFDSVYASQQEAQKAKDKQRVAEKELERQQKKAEQLGDALMAAQEQYIQDPTNIKAEGALTQALNDIDGQNEVVQEYEQSLQNAEEAAAQAQRKHERETEKALAIAREQAEMDIANEDAQRALAAVQAVVEQEATEPHENRIGQQINEQAAEEAINQTMGTAYTNDNVPVQFHYALANVDDLVTSNTDAGEVNPAYPEDLQPRDRTRQANIDQVNNIARNLNPARLGESASVQDGAPIVGADNIVESGNGRTMAIRQAFQRIPEAAARYTQWLRDNAARFGLDPEAVTDRSMLVRVRDTDVDRGAFARSANESTTAGYSASETAESDAANLTPEIMELFNPDDNGNLDSTGNHSFVLAFLENVIPETERGTYEQSDGTISQQGQQRIRNAVFQKAYGSTNLTRILTEATDGNSRNVVNALLKAAPRAVELQGAIDQGGVYDVNLGQKIAAAVQRFMQLRSAGMNVDTYLGQTTMPGMETEDAGTQAFMRLFDEFKRSPKKLAEALQNTMDALVDAGDPRVVSFLGQGDAPSVESLVRQGVSRLSQARAALTPSAYKGNANTPAQNSTTGNVVSGQDTIDAVTDALGITNDRRVKKFLRQLRNTTRGYTYNNGVIHTKNAQDTNAAVHEIGHNLDVRMGMKAWVKDMDALAQQYTNQVDPNFLLGYDPSEYGDELMAEFSRVWANDRNTAVSVYGSDFVNRYEQELKKNGWLKAMQNAAEQMRRWDNASSIERAESMVTLDVKKNKEKISLNKLRTNLADHTLPLQQITDAFVKAGLKIDASKDTRTLALANPSMVANLTQANLYGQLTDIQGNSIKKKDGTEYGSLADVTKKVGKNREKAFNTYLLAKLQLERGPQGKSLLGKNIDAQQVVTDYENKYSDFQGIANELYDWFQAFEQNWWVGNGISQKNFDALRALYPSYIPLMAADSKPSGGSKRTDADPSIKVKKAYETDVNKYNPAMALVETVQKQIAAVKQIETMRAFDAQMKQLYAEGLGMAGIAEPAQKDVKAESYRNANEAAKQEISDLIDQLQGATSPHGISTDAADKLLDALDNLPAMGFVYSDKATGNDVINIPMEDGSFSSWTVYDPQVLKAITMTKPGGRQYRVARAIAGLTRFLSANATSRSLKFSGQNVFSDIETIADTAKTGYGSMAKDIAMGTRPVHIAKEVWAGLDLLRNMAAETAIGQKIGMETSEKYEAFKKFGLMGNRYAFREGRSQRETRNALYGGHKSFGEAVLAVAKSPINFVEAVSNFGEEMSRYNTFGYSGFDLSTYDGKLAAGRASREGSVDFSKFGAAADSNAYKMATTGIAFLNAQIQGIDKTLDTLSEIKNDPYRRGVLVGRLAVNSLMLGALTAGLRQIMWGDDEEEGYKELTDYEKSKFIHLFRWPNGSWFKVKRSQDMFIQTADLLGEMAGEMLSGYDGDALSDLANGMREVVKNGFISTDTVFQPMIDAVNGTTWYGSDVDTYTEKTMSKTARYGVETSKAARLVSTLTGGLVSPNAAEYAVKQYLGSTGTLGTVIFDTLATFAKDRRIDGSFLYNWVKDDIASGFVVDPVFSNRLATAYYTGKENLDYIVSEGKSGKAPELLRSNLTQEEMNAAYAEAVALTSKGGAVYDLGKTYSDLKKQYNATIDPESTLTPAQQEDEARRLKHEMNMAMLEANTVMGDYFNKYGYSNGIEQAVFNTLNVLTGEKETPELPVNETSVLTDAVKGGDIETALETINSLIESGKKTSTVKSAVTREIKPIYKSAYESGDWQKVKEIEQNLKQLGLKYTSSDFRNWLK